MREESTDPGVRRQAVNPLPEGWRDIAQAVQDEVNAFQYKADVPGTDDWDSGQDCENYALGKLRRLVEAGFPIERLRLATCFVGGTGPANRGEAHCVLVLDAPDDHYVLDNRFAMPVLVSALIAGGNTLEVIQKGGGSREWIKWKHT